MYITEHFSKKMPSPRSDRGIVEPKLSMMEPLTQSRIPVAVKAQNFRRAVILSWGEVMEVRVHPSANKSSTKALPPDYVDSAKTSCWSERTRGAQKQKTPAGGPGLSSETYAKIPT